MCGRSVTLGDVHEAPRGDRLRVLDHLGGREHGGPPDIVLVERGRQLVP